MTVGNYMPLIPFLQENERSNKTSNKVEDSPIKPYWNKKRLPYKRNNLWNDHFSTFQVWNNYRKKKEKKNQSKKKSRKRKNSLSS